MFEAWLKVRRADTLAQSDYLREEKLADLDKLAELGEAEIKAALNFALDAVIDEVAVNEHEALMAYIKENFR